MNELINSKKDIENLTNIPVITEIPYINQFKNLREQKFSLVPYYKNTILLSIFEICIFLKYFSNYFFIKDIAISSLIPENGKTLISILLAKALSVLNYKTLLIDADASVRQIHTRLNIKNNLGLADLFYDPYLKVQTVINKVSKNLHVISSGNRKSYTKLIKENNLTKDLLYDYNLTPDQYIFSSHLIFNVTNNIRNLNLHKFIIYDSTILGTTQNDSLASQIDGTILVVPLNKIKKKLFKSKLKRLKEKNIFIFGIILNNLS